jgi:hypothetical protein
MPDQITGYGTNSQGNDYDTRVDSSGNEGYHYSKYVSVSLAYQV